MLHRVDPGLALREKVLQAMFDLGAGGAPLDCWRHSGDVR